MWGVPYFTDEEIERFRPGITKEPTRESSSKNEKIEQLRTGITKGLTLEQVLLYDPDFDKYSRKRARTELEDQTQADRKDENGTTSYF